MSRKPPAFSGNTLIESEEEKEAVSVEEKPKVEEGGEKTGQKEGGRCVCEAKGEELH